jgi:hypothetical protein
MSSDPFCGNCGYNLRGLTESSKCPECGQPIVEVLQRPPVYLGGRRYRSPITVFGLPLVDVAVGPYGEERRGRAWGIIAIGDVATGWLAIGGYARGILAFGGVALGLISFGGLAIGLLLAAGGGALGGLAVGGLGVGGLAIGGAAVGVVAEGGGAVGYYAHGGGAFGTHVIDATHRDPDAVRFFSGLAQQAGVPAGAQVLPRVMLPLGICVVVGLASICTLLVVGAYALRSRDDGVT